MSFWPMSESAQAWHDGDIGLIPIWTIAGEVRAYVVVDSADLEWLSKWRWGLTKGGYAFRQVRFDGTRQRRILMHRELLGLATGDLRQGDHIDRDRLNNRRSNLRIVTKGQNGQNKSSYRGSSSRFRGVTLERRSGKWVAQVEVGGKAHYLGKFDDEEQAAEVARVERLRRLAYAVD